MGQSAMLIIIWGIVMIIAGVAFLGTRLKKPALKVKGVQEQGVQTPDKLKQADSNSKDIAITGVQSGMEKGRQIKRVEKPVEKKDMAGFMEFDKIANDMIYQDKGSRYTMVIQCKGMNYHLMSELEQMAVEEGFIMFLNTLKFPIQLYVQTKSIDLTENVRDYKERTSEFIDKQNEVAAQCAMVEDDVDSTQEEIDYMLKEKLKYTNIAEYAADITRYVEKMATNKYMLQRSFYIIFSYHKSELATTENFSEAEYEDLCYNELYTRAQGILGSLLACSVTGKILNSNELAELVYTSMNKDDASVLSVKDALESGLFRLYTSSEDVLKKRREMLDQAIEIEGKKRVEEAIKEAMAKGLIVTPAESEEEAQKEIDKRAMNIIDKSAVNSDVKKELKNIIRDNRKKRVEKLREELAEIEKNSIIEIEEDNDDDAKDAGISSQNVLVNDNDNVILDDEHIIQTKEGEKTDEK